MGRCRHGPPYLAATDPLRDVHSQRAPTAAALCTLYVIDDPADGRADRTGEGAWTRTFALDDVAAQQAQAELELRQIADELSGTLGPLDALLELHLTSIPAHTWKAIERAVVATVHGSRGTAPDPADLLAHVVLATNGSDPWATDFFPTPSTLGRLLAAMAGTSPMGWTLDGAAGTGSLMASAYLTAVETHGRSGADSISWIAIELVSELATIARLQMLCVGAARCSWIAAGNSLSQPLLGRSRQDGKLKELQITNGLANPPFNAQTNAVLNDSASTEPLIAPDAFLYRTIEIPRPVAA